MPKKYYSQKRRRKPAYMRHGMNALTLASKSLSVAYGVKRLINVEQKFHDVFETGADVVDTVGTIIPLTNIAQGDTDQTRDGSQIKLMSLDFKGVVRVNSAVTAIGSNVTVMLVLDKQTNQAIYNTADLLANTTASLSVYSPLNLENKFRFRVLKRWIFQINAQGANRKVLKWYHKFGNNMKIRYDASTPDISDLTSKSLSLIFIGNDALAGSTKPRIQYYVRLRYVDN